MSTPTGYRYHGRLAFRDLADALCFARYAAQQVPGLAYHLEEGELSTGRPWADVILQTSQTMANELLAAYQRGGRREQERRDAARGEGAWE